MSRARPLPYSSFDYTDDTTRQQLRVLTNLIHNHALEARTWDNYARHVRNYTNLCQRLGLQAFPVSATSLITFFTHHLATNHAASTMDGIQSAIKKEQTLQGCPEFLDPYQEGCVKSFKRAAKKLFYVAPRRKRPLTVQVLLSMAAVANHASPRDQQYLAMSFVAHDGLLRFSELAALRVRDVVWDHSLGTVYLIVRDSKANKGGPPELVAMQAYGSLSGTALLQAYWAQHQLQEASPEDFLFPLATIRGRTPKGEIPVSKSRFIDWVRQLLRRIGLPGHEFSGHSFRSGGATDMWNRRMPASFIKLIGRWRSEAYAIYCRDHPAESALSVASAFHDICCSLIGPYAI